MPSLLETSEAILSGKQSIDSHHPLQIGSGAKLEPITEDLAFVESFSNVVVASTHEGLFMVDAGSPLHADAIHTSIRAWSDQHLHTAVFTHGHVDHIYAVRNFESEPGGSAHVIGHEAVEARFRRYELTNGYNGVINQRQFQLGAPLFPGGYRYPDETFRDQLDLTVGGLDAHLFHDRGETDDGTWVWLPEHKIVCTGDLFIWASPNCGNPQKAQRYCDEWAIALRKMAALRPEFLLPGHGLPIAGAERIQTVLTETADYLESLFTQTIEMMNSGSRLDEIIQTVKPPAHLTDRPWLQPVYDEPEFIVRNIWRLYGGWYDGNPSHLKPPPESALASEIATLAGGPEALAERALQLLDLGEDRLATSLVELASLATPEPGVSVMQARSQIFAARAQAERSTMAKGVYAWAKDRI